MFVPDQLIADFIICTPIGSDDIKNLLFVTTSNKKNISL
jgi:hypothetical protein